MNRLGRFKVTFPPPEAHDKLRRRYIYDPRHSALRRIGRGGKLGKPIRGQYIMFHGLIFRAVDVSMVLDRRPRVPWWSVSSRTTDH